MAYRGRKRKDAIILAIDIGKNSTRQDSDGKTYFEKSIYCASSILKRKILTKSEDHFALILFGSSHTINHLSSSQEDSYDSIETVSGLRIATWSLFNRVNSLSPTKQTPSDWISTFVLAADMLRNKTRNKDYTGLQIIIFSNLATDISFGNLDIIATCLKMENIRLSILGKDCEAISLNPGPGKFLKTTQATAVNFDLVLPKMSYYKQKEVTAKTWNAPLSFGEVFDIKVFGYEKIDITTKSSNWLFSKNYDTQDLTIAKKKHADNNGVQMEVDNELPMGDFCFGDEIIPVIDLDTNECTYIVSGRRCLQVLGFVKTTNTQSSFLMDGGSYIFKPHETDIIAFNAIFDSMVKREEVMLVRKVDLYMNLLNIGALFPQKKENEKFFVYVSLPYDEKKYTYRLPSLNSIKSHLKEKIAPKHTDAIDKGIDDRNTFAMPENEYDFELQSLYDCIVQQILTKIIPEKIQRSKKRLYRQNDEPHLKNFSKRIAYKDKTIRLDHDRELDDPNKLIEHHITFNEYAEQLINEFRKTWVKQEVFENYSAEDNNTKHFGYDEELDGSNKLIKRPRTSNKNDEPLLNALKNTWIKQEVFENSSAENINTIHFGYDEKLDISNKLINRPTTSNENAKPLFNELKNTWVKQEGFENGSDEDINTIHFGYDEKLDISNKLINRPTTSNENAKPLFNELKKTWVKQEVFENGSDEDINTIHFGYDEELDIANKLINRPTTSNENAKPLFTNGFKKTFSLKQEVFENGSDEDINGIHFGYDEELDIANKLINRPTTSNENAKPLFTNEFKKTFSLKQEVFENGSDEDIYGIHFGYDEELDIANKLKNRPITSNENAKPLFNELKNSWVKQEGFENGSYEDIYGIHFGYDEELDISNKLMNRPITSNENAKPLFNELKNSWVKHEGFENGSYEDIYGIHFGYDEELDISNKLMNRPITSNENAKPLFNELKNSWVKQEGFENGSYEDIYGIHFGYDEELDISNKLMNRPITSNENAKPLFNELKNSWVKQEGFENGSDEDINGIHFGYDEKLDISNKLKNRPTTSNENAKPLFNELKKTWVKQEVFENGSDEDINTIHSGYDEELDVSNKLINRPTTSNENAKPPLTECIKICLHKQEVLENGSDEDINTIHFGYDEKLDISNKLINRPTTSKENAKPLFNELKKTWAKQEVFENGSDEDINTIHSGYDEELEVSNKLINRPTTSNENAEPPLTECIKICLHKQEVLENRSDEDINSIHFGNDEELDVSEQCVITPLNPIEDFYKLLGYGFDSEIVCEEMQNVTLNLIEFSISLEDLMRPIATLKALRDYYINNDDAKSYNNFMYLVKNAVLTTGKEDIWSEFINSGIGLITNAELEESDISQESSEEFNKLSGVIDIIIDDSQLEEFP